MNRKNYSGEAYAMIIADIMSGSLKPGSIVTETTLAGKYRISRTPVREALVILECEGLVTTKNRTRKIYTLNASDINEIFELKELIEGHIAYRAADKISQSQADELRAIVAEMKSLGKSRPGSEQESSLYLEKWLDADRRFHALLFNAAGNLRASQVTGKLNIQWHKLKIGLAAMEGRIGYAISEHEAIALAVIGKNPEKARKEMVDHLENLKRYLIRLMGIFGS